MQALLNVVGLQVNRRGFFLSAKELIVERKKISCLVGKSGSGKSTVLLSVAGFVPESRGKIFYEGVEISHLRPEKRRLGLVFQKSALFPHLNVLKNVEFGLKMRGENKKLREEKAMQWLKNLQIDSLAQKNPLQISGGEAQRVALARVLVMDFSLILLDEPFSALDLELRTELRVLLKELIEKHDRGALLVTHDLEDVEALSSINYRIQNGVVEQF